MSLYNIDQTNNPCVVCGKPSTIIQTETHYCSPCYYQRYIKTIHNYTDQGLNTDLCQDFGTK